MFKQIVICAMLINFAMANLATAQQAPPSSDKARQIETLVDKAAALIDSKGKAAFAEFRVKDSEWFHGDTYLPSRPARGPRSRVRRTPMASCSMTQ
jgi:cytochrome c